MELNKRINDQLFKEEHLRRAYNAYRREKGLEPVDFAEDLLTKKVALSEEPKLKI